MIVKVDLRLQQKLIAKGIDNSLVPNVSNISKNSIFEPPCRLHRVELRGIIKFGAFSYGVNGFYMNTSIGRYCSFGESVNIGRGNHPIDWLTTSPIASTKDFKFTVGNDYPFSQVYNDTSINIANRPKNINPPITIGNDVWIGHGAYLKTGITINDGAIIGAHAVVTKDVPPYAIVVGNPAVVKKYRFSDNIIQRLLKLKWWELPAWELKDIPFNNINAA